MSSDSYASLMVTSGNGPAECRQAVAHVIERMKAEAYTYRVSLVVYSVEGKHGPKSAVVQVYGKNREAFVKAWLGTVLWRMESQLRRCHKRANWFIGVFELGEEGVDCSTWEICASDVQFTSLRAGGPGGQHQNTTESAIRATHRTSGLSVVVRDERSQHRNKALAMERLKNLAIAGEKAERDQRRNLENNLHGLLERGNPVRKFAGPRFEEKL